MKKRFWALRDKYLPALLITLFAAIAADGQVYQRNLTGYGNQGRRLAADSTINIPTGCGAPTTTQEHGMQGEMRMAKLFYDSCNAKFYVYNPSTSTWNTAATGSGAGISEIIAGYGLLTVNDSTQKVDTSLIATKLYALHLKDSILANIPATGPPGIGQVVGTNGLDNVDDSTLQINFVDSADANTQQARKIIAAWGDSMTELPAGGSYTSALQTLLGNQVFTKAISGNTSTEIRTRFEAEPSLWKYATIIWSGANNFASKTTVVQDIEAMVDSLGHNNYVVIGVTKTTLQTVGTPTSDQVDALNDTLRQVFGVHFKDANDYFVNVVPALTSQDNTDRTNEIPLSSYRSDNQHLNTLGSVYMARFIRDSCLSQLTPAYMNNALHGDDVFEAFQNRSSISSVGAVKAVNTATESGLDITAPGSYAYRAPEKLTNNLMTSDLSGWTATDWTWANPGATHTTGNTSVLSQNVTSVLVGQLYQIEFTVTSGAGTVDCDFGTVKVFDPVSITNATIKRLVLAPSTGTQLLKFTPTSTFNGTITNVTVRLVRNEREANINVRDTANNILFQLRTYPNDYFTIGKYNGIFNQTSSQSVVIGDYAGRELANATGMTIMGYAAGQRNNNSSYGTLYGYQAGRELRESSWYTGIGTNSLFAATTAQYITGIGGRALESTTTADANTGTGYYVLGRYTTGGSNTGSGFQAGAYGTTGSNNSFFGRDAGIVADGATNGYYTGSNSTFLGARTAPWSRSQSNQMAIGIYNRRLIGYDGLQHFKFNALNYDDNNIFTNVSFDFHSITGGLRPPYMTEAQRDAISTPGHASIIFNLDDNQFNWYDSIATAWQVLGSGGGSGTNNSNIGSGFRLLKPAAQEIKTLFAAYGIIIDSTTNTDGITFRADTATLFTALRATLSGGASGTVASGTQYRLGVYNATGNTISEHVALSGGRALVTDVNGLPTTSTVLATELEELKGVDDNVQDQFDRWHNRRTNFSYFNEMISNIGTSNDGGGLISAVNGTGSSFAQALTPDANRPGINRATTGTTTTGRAASINSVTSLIFGGGTWDYATDLRFQAISTPTETFAFIAGFYDVFTAVDQTDGIYFLYDSAGTSTGSTATNKWQCVTVSNSTRTFTTTTVDVSASTWVSLEIQVNAAGTSVDFIIDGVTVATHTTNIPTGSSRQAGFGHYIQKSAGTTARYVDVDFLEVKSTFTSSR